MAAVQEERSASQTLAPEPARSFRLSWWAYPAAAAALLLIGIIIMSNSAPGKLEATAEVQQLAMQLEASAPTVRILDQAEDPALDRLDAVEKQVLSLHTPDEGLFEVDSPEVDR